jgi:hypothetical protein
MCTSLRIIKRKLFSCSTNRRSFSGPRHWRNPEIDVPVLKCLKDLRNKGLPVTSETLISKAKECARKCIIPFEASRGWYEKFMKTEIVSLRRKTKISEKLPSEFETKLTEFQRFAE